jgi:16S rRNA (adenine1518-N6/adenine1519-N6)-dimethyltransferase
MDKRCLPALAELGEAFPGQLKVIEGDALKVDPATLFDGPWHVVANLPYNVGTALFTGWLSGKDWPPAWQSLTLMFQLEVAERIVAGTDSDAFGRLAVLAQWRATPRIAMKVHRSAFTPPPKVMSAIVHVTPAAMPEGRAAHARTRDRSRLWPAPQDAAPVAQGPARRARCARKARHRRPAPRRNPYRRRFRGYRAGAL